MNSQDIYTRLIMLIDENPAQAIEEARNLESTYEHKCIQSKIFIDAGFEIKDTKVISEGINIVHELMDEKPEFKSDFSYNLANGLHSLSLCSIDKKLDWYLHTHDVRQEARYWFNIVRGTDNVHEEIKTQASTNFGNILNSSYRWVEAYDAYMNALEIEPKNGVASSGAIKILNHSLTVGIGDENLIISEQTRLADITRNSRDKILKFAGPRALQVIEDMIKDFPQYEGRETYTPKDSYEKFILENNLTLSPTIISENLDLIRWDNLRIKFIVEPVGTESTIPAIFAMLNVMKADYILARLLFFKSINEEIQDTNYYSDTLDYATYSTNSSLLALAQRCAIDLLDKIAVAALDYFHIKGAKRAHFKSAWFSEVKDKPKWRTEIDELIKDGHKPLIALSEIALDLSTQQGFLKTKSDVRNASTHRFVVLHDLGIGNYRKSDCVEHFDIEDFKIETLETLKLARAALIYFVELIHDSEDRKINEIDGNIPPMNVPSHHYIRGDE